MSATVPAKVITGGQTGADQAGWRAAKRFGIPTGGLMPKGYKTEEGPRPTFAELYGASESTCRSYPARTLANIRISDAVWIFAVDPQSPGSQLTATKAYESGISSVVFAVNLGEPILPIRPQAAARWLLEKQIGVLNVAGNRESKAPGIGAWVESYLCEVFRQLGFTEPTS